MLCIPGAVTEVFMGLLVKAVEIDVVTYQKTSISIARMNTPIITTSISVGSPFF
jgi:hypothetical protein